MADKPILFSKPMVLALLAGTKTQTRRAIRLPEWATEIVYDAFHGWRFNSADHFESLKLRISVGDRLYVREHWRTGGANDHLAPRDLPPEWARPIEYYADQTDIRNGRFRQGMHMPRWASRLTLTVTDVRVERLIDCTDGDALAEGVIQVQHREGGAIRYSATGAKFGLAQQTPKLAYAHLWDSINGEDAWSENPWVAAYTFTVHQGNIDAPA